MNFQCFFFSNVVKIKCLRGLRKVFVLETNYHYHLERNTELSNISVSGPDFAR